VTLPLATAAAGAVAVALNGYVLLGGADFGGGVWDALASGPRRDAQGALVAHAIGPIWEANHVWLIIAVVLLFTCFPPAFALMTTALHVPLSIALIGIVLRGSSFTFRSYDTHSAAEERWSRVFAVTSVVTPLLLGVSAGAIASERVSPPAPGASFVSAYLTPWLTPFSVAVGVFVLALFAFLAAVYLTVEAERNTALQEDFRWRALGSAVVVFVVALVTLLLGQHAVPRLRTYLLSSPEALLFQAATAAAAITAICALIGRRYRLARVAAAAQVTLILWGWLLAQYPYVIPPTLTVTDAAAPPATLRAIMVALVAGAVLLFPSLAYLFGIFKADPAPSRPQDDLR
jgi:cytochrome bd ubiquinol oxidase subunit II